MSLPLLRSHPLITESQISSVPLFRRGKVRDVYDLGENLLFVTTDRVSAFDVILPSAVPEKGRVLTQMSLFWFRYLEQLVPNHIVTADLREYPASLQPYHEELNGRSVIVRKAERIDIECVVRGYLAGSFWKEYREMLQAGKSTLHGFPLSPDLIESSRLPEPIFTPATKNDSGHDENISFQKMIDAVGKEVAAACRDLSLAIYARGCAHAESRGILIADTKFEFGFIDGKISLIDEALTPDSSRFWPRDQYMPGKGQPSFDKQPIRDYLETLDWNKQSPGPKLPESVITATTQRYIDVYERLSGKKYE